MEASKKLGLEILQCYGIIKHMVKAKKILHEKVIDTDGSVLEIVIWQLPEPIEECPHGLKYRFYFGLWDGTCLVRYDNEKGKGSHCHKDGKEEPYVFQNIDQLLRDFFEDVTIARGERNES